MKRFNYHKGDYEKFVWKFRIVNGKKNFMEEGINNMWIAFRDTILDIWDRNVPRQPCLPENKSPSWMTNKVTKMIRERNRLGHSVPNQPTHMT